ncbi:MAG: ADOP family duplicated permease [Gemmatimonadaceae bacterium]
MTSHWWKGGRRLRGDPWPVSIDDEVDADIAAHIELHTRDLMSRGLTAVEARAEAIRRFGDPELTRRELRSIRRSMELGTRRSEMRNDLKMDAAFALRMFRRSPLFTCLLVITIAVAIAANATIFRVIDAVLLRPLPYRHADRVYALWNGYQQGRASVAAPEYFDYAEQLRTFESVAAITPQPTALAIPGEEVERVSNYAVTPNLFSLLGVEAAVGRAFQPGDGQRGAERVIVLSHSLWMRRFGGDRTAIGRAVSVAGRPATIVGVMPSGMRFPDAPIDFLRERADIWLANDFEHLRGDERGNQIFATIGRQRAGVSEREVRADIAMLERRFKQAYPERYAPLRVPDWRLEVVPLRDEMLGAVEPALAAMVGAVILLLTIACANVAGLLIARSRIRRREMAVRLALGAARRRLVRQLLTESTLLGLLGGGVGLALARLLSVVIAQFDPGGIPRLDQARFSPLVIGVSLVLSLLTGLAVGIIPALGSSRDRLRDALSDDARAATGGSSGTMLRRVLVASQVALAVVVLVAAGLLGKTLLSLRSVDTGLAAENVHFMRIDLPSARYDSAYKTLAFYERLRGELQAIGDAHVGAVYPLPMSGEGWSGSYFIPAITRDQNVELHAEYAVSEPGYFRVAGISMLEGRDFTQDDKADTPPVVIIDDVLAHRHWPGQSAIGKQINPNRGPGEWATVVGVARHVRNAGPRNDGEPQIYLPHAQHAQLPMAVVFRSQLAPNAAIAGLRVALRRADPQVPASRIGTMDALIAAATATDRFYAVVIAAFAATALLLASFGLYGVMSSLVEQRRREIGIRAAMGGSPAAIRWLVMREGVLVTLVGLAVGTLAAFGSTRLLAGLLYGVRPTDPLTYAVIALIVLTVSALAGYAPLKKATRVDPIEALRV